MRWTSTAFGLLVACATIGPATAQSKSGAETSLVGIRLYDTGMRLVSVYGSPDEIYPVSVAGGAVGGAGGLGGGMGMPGGGLGNRGGMGMPGGGMGMPGGMSGMPGGISGVPPGAGRGMAPGGMGGPMGAPMGLIDTNNPFGFGDSLLKQLPPGARGGLQGGAGLQSAPPGMGGPTGMQMGMGGPPPGFSMGGGSPSGMGGVPGVPGRGGMGGGANMGMGAGNNAAAQVATFTRWVYNRSGSKYGFILDKAGKVVQIEAVGMKNPKVRTKRGVGFGANFATIMKKYGSPDSYEIAGDTILMKYLTRQKVAFRLSRLYEGKPQVVTGVVVAAGKS